MLQGIVDRAWGEVLWLQTKVAQYDPDDEEGARQLIMWQSL